MLFDPDFLFFFEELGEQIKWPSKFSSILSLFSASPTSSFNAAVSKVRKLGSYRTDRKVASNLSGLLEELPYQVLLYYETMQSSIYTIISSILAL